MQIVVHDTVTLLQPLFTSRERPKDLFRKAHPILFGPGGLSEAMQPVMKERDRHGFGVMAAVQQDGYEVLFGQQAWGLFNPTRRRELSDWEFAQLAAFDMCGRLETWLGEFAGSFQALAKPERIACFVLPGDPANRTFMADNHGLSLFGGVPGFILARAWPSPGNLARLKAALARAFAHNLRWANAPSNGRPSLADFLALEGLAAAFVSRAVPESLIEPWLVAFRKPDDWEATLSWVARQYGVTRYDNVMVNVYGSAAPVGPARPPDAVPLTPDELAYARAVITEALAETEPNRIAAYLYGDHLAAAQGHPSVGLPPYAGFEVAYRDVQAYLRASGQDLQQALMMPSDALFAPA